MGIVLCNAGAESYGIYLRTSRIVLIEAHSLKSQSQPIFHLSSSDRAQFLHRQERYSKLELLKARVSLCPVVQIVEEGNALGIRFNTSRNEQAASYAAPTYSSYLSLSRCWRT